MRACFLAGLLLAGLLVAAPASAQRLGGGRPFQPGFPSGFPGGGGETVPAKPMTFDEAVKALKSDDEITKLQGLMNLADLGVKAEKALPDLLPLLDSKSEDLRLNTAIALGKLGKVAVPELVKRLGAESNDTRFYAIWSLGWIGADAKSAAPLLIKAMRDKNDGIRRKAAFALGQVAGDPDETVKVLLAAFKDEAEDVRLAASDAVSKFGAAAVPGLLDYLKGDSLPARLQAASALGEMGSDAKEAVAPLKTLLLAKETANVTQYAQALKKIGKAAVPALEAGFKDPRADVRGQSAQALSEIGSEAVGVFVDGLGDKNVEIRRLSAGMLAPMRIGDKSVVIALAYGLKDADDQVRQNCLSALQQLGAQAKLASKALNEAMADMNTNVRMNAFHTLQNMGENPGPGLSKALQSADDRVRINTACLMVSVNIDVANAMPHLVDALKHKDGALRMQAAFVMAQRRQEVGKLTPFFIEGLKHETAGVRAQAAQGLQMLAGAAAEAATPLAEALGDSDANVRQQAASALMNLRGKADEVVPILKKHFKSDDEGTRSLAVMCAPLYGKEGAELVLAGLKDKSVNVRQQAVNALQRTGQVDKSILPALVEIAKDKSNQSFRAQIVHMLGRGGAEGLDLVIPFLKDEDAQMRSSAVQAIQSMGKAGVKAMPELAKMLRGDKTDQVRHQAIYALVNLGPEGADHVIGAIKDIKDVQTRNVALSAIIHNSQRRDKAIPILVEMMKDPEPQMRTMALNYCQNLGNIKECLEIVKLGVKDKDSSVRMTAVYACQNQGQNAWPLLEEAAKDAKDTNLRVALVNAYLNTGYKSKAAVPSLIEYLQDKNPQVRWQSCQVLQNIGADAKEAVPAIRELVKDTHPTVRQIAQNALNVLAPEKK